MNCKRIPVYVKDYLHRINRGYERYEKLIKGAVTCLAIVAALLVFGRKGENHTISGEFLEETGSMIASASTSATTSAPETKNILTDISGEVFSPGVYELKEGSRLQDLINAAGGLTEEADIDAINRASLMKDGEKVYIPSINDNYSPISGGRIDPSGEDMGSGSSKRININRAGEEELQGIKGVGPATAKRIVDYREEYGPFSNVDELKNVSGIGDKTFEKMKDYIEI